MTLDSGHKNDQDGSEYVQGMDTEKLRRFLGELRSQWVPVTVGALLLAWAAFAVLNPSSAVSRPRYEILLTVVGGFLLYKGLKWTWKGMNRERTAMPTGPDV